VTVGVRVAVAALPMKRHMKAVLVAEVAVNLHVPGPRLSKMGSQRLGESRTRLWQES
jgi:hypothetical protein